MTTTTLLFLLMPLHKLCLFLGSAGFQHVKLGLQKIDNFIPVFGLVQVMRKFSFRNQVAESHSLWKVGEFKLAEVQGVPGLDFELGITKVQNFGASVDDLWLQMMIVHVLQDEVAIVASEAVCNNRETLVLLLEQPPVNIQFINKSLNTDLIKWLN